MADFAYTLLFIVLLALPVISFVFLPLCMAKYPKIGIATILIYLLSYILPSLTGKNVVNNHGGSEWWNEWCPKHLIYDYVSPSGRIKTSYTMLGAIYWPCILIDHTAWHQSKEAQE